MILVHQPEGQAKGKGRKFSGSFSGLWRRDTRGQTLSNPRALSQTLRSKETLAMKEVVSEATANSFRQLPETVLTEKAYISSFAKASGSETALRESST